jgi:predicted enzyme related to lactoylglutathione lyase
MNTVGYFEIQSSQPEREINFYHNVFGWNFTLEPHAPNEYYRIETRNMHGGLLKRTCCATFKRIWRSMLLPVPFK